MFKIFKLESTRTCLFNERNAENASNAFDWLTAHQENFDKNVENLELKEFLDKQVKMEKSFQDLKTKAKSQHKQMVKYKSQLFKICCTI